MAQQKIYVCVECGKEFTEPPKIELPPNFRPDGPICPSCTDDAFEQLGDN